MRSRMQNEVAGAFRRYERRTGTTNGEYPTPSQIAFRIAAFLLVALCVALAANFIANAMGA